MPYMTVCVCIEGVCVCVFHFADAFQKTPGLNRLELVVLRSPASHGLALIRWHT